MRHVVLAAAGLGLIVSVGASAQAPQHPRRHIESQPADTMHRTPDQNTQGKPAADSRGANNGDGVTVGKNGDPIGATNDDKGRQGEAHSDPTLATKPPPASDPKFQ